MKLSLHWLQEYIPLKVSPQKLAEKLTAHVVEVEDVLTPTKGLSFKNCIVGKVVKLSPHPDADRLRVALVNTGSEEKTIVTGAPNIAVGQTVALALPGAEVLSHKDGRLIKIKAATLRGVASQGMVCGLDELGQQNETTDGIAVLDDALTVGTPLSKVFSLVDTGSGVVLDIENKAIPHRPDLSGHQGYAYEVAAVFGGEVRISEDPELLQGSKPALTVRVEDEKICSRFMGILLDVKVGESPSWLKQKLAAVGVSSINNVVDVTNLLAFDIGQPMHAFDAAGVADNTLWVRYAKPGEHIETLDGTMLKLQPHHAVVATKDGLIDVAGIIGGKGYGVTNQTTRVVLQSATWNPAWLRRAARELGVTTEASTRFAKGLDPNQAERAVRKAVRVLAEIADAKVANKLFDYYPEKSEPQTFTVRADRVNAFIGQPLSRDFIEATFTKLGFTVTLQKDGAYEVAVPTRRRDIQSEDTLIGELARIYGFNKLATTTLPIKAKVAQFYPSYRWESRAKNTLMGAGFYEVQLYSFTSQKTVTALGMDTAGHQKIINAISPDVEYLRASLLPNLLMAAKHNLSYQNSFNIFELGHVYYGIDGTPQTRYGHEKLEEERMLAGLVVISKQAKVRSPFFSAKGAVQLLLGRLGIKAQAVFRRLALPHQTFHPGKTAMVEVDGRLVGYVGELHPAVMRALKISGAVGFFDLNFEALAELASHEQSFEDISKFPAVTLDVSVVVPEETKVGDMAWEVQDASKLVQSVSLSDIFRSEQKIGKGKKSVTLSMSYQALNKTLTDQEVQKEHQKVVRLLGKKYQAEIRSK